MQTVLLCFAFYGYMNCPQWICVICLPTFFGVVALLLDQLDVKLVQVLVLMQMYPKGKLRRVILTASWLDAINLGY